MPFSSSEFDCLVALMLIHAAQIVIYSRLVDLVAYQLEQFSEGLLVGGSGAASCQIEVDFG